MMIKSFKIFNENADYITELNLDMETGQPFAFKFNDNFKIGKIGEFHGGAGLYDDYIYPGRIWIEDKVLSFWVYPTERDFTIMINTIEKTIGEKIMNNGWRIEIREKKDGERRIAEPSSNLYHNDNSESDREILIPVEQYSGSEDVPEEIIKIHLLKGEAKQKALKKLGYKPKYSTMKLPKGMSHAQYNDKKSKYKYSENIKSFDLFEISSYLNLHGDDDYNIEQVVEDDRHDYQYVDGIKYELSGSDEVVNIEQVEATEENMFYEDQIERYIEYFNDGGVVQTFPVQVSKIADNLESMLEYLDESENFDVTYELLKDKHDKLFNIFMDVGLSEIVYNSSEYGFIEDELKSIYNEKDLDEYYYQLDEDDEDYAIMEYFDEEKEYTLTDFNHRFEALKRMGKKRVMVEE